MAPTNSDAALRSHIRLERQAIMYPPDDKTRIDIRIAHPSAFSLIKENIGS